MVRGKTNIKKPTTKCGHSLRSRGTQENFRSLAPRSYHYSFLTTVVKDH